MQINRSPDGSGPRPPEPTFTGEVRIDGYVRRPAPSRLTGATVTFEPGARTPWKVNPLGQTVVVTAGTGWAQVEGGPVVEVRAGDVLWCPPGKRHWDGATPDTAMTCVALHEGDVRFLDRVDDEEYHRGPVAVP